MSDDAKLGIIWGTVIVFVVAIIAGSISYYNTSVIKAAMENGYEQRTLPGKVGAYWVKSESCRAEK